MRLKPLVTATEYGVSTLSGTGIVGVLLDVYKARPCEPTQQHPFTQYTEFAVRQMPFPDQDAADAYCLAHGWMKVYNG